MFLMPGSNRGFGDVFTILHAFEANLLHTFIGACSSRYKIRTSSRDAKNAAAGGDDLIP